MNKRSVIRSVTVAPVIAGLTLAPLPALAQTSPEKSIVINEVESNGDPQGDWVELANTDNINSVDISGWTIIDNDNTHQPLVIPAGTSIESGGYISFYTEGGPSDFGLGGKDSVTLRDAGGDLIDETSWTEHAATTWGRIPDKTGAFAVTAEPTRNAANVAEGENTDPSTARLPYDDIAIKNLTLGADFAVEDMSGVDFDADGRAWIVNNDAGDIFVLDHDPVTDTYTEAGHWTTTYPDGQGTPDGEGITIGTDGAIYLSTERNNKDKSVSRPSILRFDAPTTTSGKLQASDEWNLRDFTGDIGANGGLETVEHLGGTVFAAGVEETGEVLLVDLGAIEPKLLQKFDSPFKGVMALDYTPSTGKLQVLCDEVCDGASIFLDYSAGTLTQTDSNIYARPKNMNNYANEGFASHVSTGDCTDGTRTT
ncbi:lamin tail domain-containing protein [Corynebacterium pacaense]|uniref:lamin tail domain-containing protein n=1 Tax=Corynebacterium pacaense TaxID=1816684 RepID=UPI0009BC6587|nr:lamin tail domain-containing protein [Corynebacterium pacaense]